MLDARLGPSPKVRDVRPGPGPLVDLVVATGLPPDDRLGAKEICSTLKESVPRVDSVRVLASNDVEVFSAVCLGPPLGTPQNPITNAKLNPRNLTRCPVRSGGGDVRIAGVSCEEVRGTIRHWASAPVYYDKDRPQERVFEQPGGWTCYGRLHEELQVIRTVCVRGSAVVVYTFS